MEEESYEEIMAEDEPQSAAGLVEYAGDFLANYGWLLVVGAAGAYVAWTRLLGPKVSEWLERRTEDERSARYHKDPDLALARMQAMEAARARMQAQHDVVAALHAQKLQEQEEQKRQMKITDWDNHQKGLGYRNKTRVEESEASQSVAAKAKPKAKLKNNDFNPLMGAGAGSCFRPTRRGGASGGGG